MSNEQLCQIAARASAATPGPWTSTVQGKPQDRVLGPFRNSKWQAIAGALTGVGPDQGRVNAAFIASARQDVVELVAEVRRLQK